MDADVVSVAVAIRDFTEACTDSLDEDQLAERLERTTGPQAAAGAGVVARGQDHGQLTPGEERQLLAKKELCRQLVKAADNIDPVIGESVGRTWLDVSSDSSIQLERGRHTTAKVLKEAIISVVPTATTDVALVGLLLAALRWCQKSLGPSQLRNEMQDKQSIVLQDGVVDMISEELGGCAWARTSTTTDWVFLVEMSIFRNVALMSVFFNESVSHSIGTAGKITGCCQWIRSTTATKSDIRDFC